MMNKTWRIPSYSDVSCSICRTDFLHCHLNKNNSNRDSVFVLSQSWSPVTTMLMNVRGGPSRAEQILYSVTRPPCVATSHDGQLYIMTRTDFGDTSLMTKTETVLETLVYSQLNHLTRMLSGENFIELSLLESFQLFYIKLACDGSICVLF